MSKITLSKMTGKLKGLVAINTSPLTNPFCNTMSQNHKYVCSHCYSRKMLSSYRKSCNAAWETNGEILSSAILRDEDIPVINERYVRVNAHGEFINKIHLQNIALIAKRNKGTRFVAWSKRKILVRRVSLPSNLILIYSTPEINPTKMAFSAPFKKVFSVFTSPELAKINCGGKKCIECMLCYNSKTVFINELLKH